MKEVLLGVVVPWVSMLPFVLVMIATIEMVVDWLPSRLPDDPPTEPIPRVVVMPGRNGFAMLITDPEWCPCPALVDPTDFITRDGSLHP